MSKKKGTSNYSLNSDAVEELVNAEKGETPQYSEGELNRYRSKSPLKLSELVKVLLLKLWFAGAVCYFILWGLGVYLTNTIDMMFVLGFALGVVTDLLTNNVIRFIEKNPGDNDKWLMFPKKNTLTLFLNVLYGFLILYCVYNLYVLINSAYAGFIGNADTVILGVEPVLFGTFCMGFDMLFIFLRDVATNLFRDAKSKVRGK